MLTHAMSFAAGRALAAAAVLAALAAGAAGQVTPQGGMIRYPDVSKTHIAFVYAGDIWLVPRAGGTATRLASPAGQELFPKFSPDGKTIAFVGNYDGNRDIYTIPVEGGTATRVTYHPSTEILCDWTPDGRVLYSMSGLGGLRRQTQLFVTGAAGGMPEQLPVPYGANGAIKDGGEWLAYTPHSTDTRTWKRYRGGMATDVWLFNLKDKTSKKATDWEGTDTIPMWFKDTVYFLSDQGAGDKGMDGDHRLNIWEYSTASGRRRQVTKFKDFDVKWPSIGPGPHGKGEIVFQNGAGLYLLDLEDADAKPRAVSVTIPGDRPALRARQVDVSGSIGGWSISPSGKRVAAEARGDIWSLPAEKGTPRNLTRSSGSAQRDPSWSPDGRWIAYFCDSTGEYELYVQQSDGLAEAVRLTKDGSAPQVFRYSPVWSPDSKMVAFTDKSGAIHLCTPGEEDGKGGFKSPSFKTVDTDPWANQPRVSWSHDSRWIAYARQDEGSQQGSVWLYNVGSGQKTRVTSGMFDDSTPTFDRKGDYLFFTSKRTFSPTYSDLDTTFIYTGTNVLMAAPLRKDMDSPWAPKSDEEEWRKTAAEGDKADKKDEKKEEKKEGEAAADDGVTGAWDGTATGPEPLPPGGMPFGLNLKLGKDGAVTGTLTSGIYSGPIASGHWDAAAKLLTFVLNLGDVSPEFSLKLDGGSMTGTATVRGATYNLSAKRAAAAADGKKPADSEKGKDKKEVVIDLEGLEARAMLVPVPAGRFGNIAVNDKGQLIYARLPVAGSGEAGIKLFDLTDEKKEEKTVASGSGFELTADGKKILILRGSSAQIQDAAAGGTAKTVVTSPMTANIDPREEWKQIFTDAWRIERDFFYDPGMHGVDWKGMRERYGKMVDDAASRDDLSFIISEMISELNVGHAYYSGGDVENGPSVSVGMLGCDFELVKGEGGKPDAYRITKILRGGPWDVDAKGPLSQPGVNVKEGDFLLAVNGVPVDTGKDPWAAFQGLANRVVTITVNDTPSLERPPAEKPAEKKEEKTATDGTDGKDQKKKDDEKKKTTGIRDVVVQCLGSEDDLRYRDWIETRRAMVEKESGGKVGYIHVPDTGQNGQNNLFRQFYGQIGKDALIIDERWNGGGQIPTRFIELLNRPRTNYWARRDGKDWPWPPDSHQGPKCMLINGLAGSGGDMFPWLFKHNGVGKLLGTRTWGGLVGISGNPGLVDGGSVTAPTFGFYETDGTWGIEGHGVDPDIEVVDDPAKMQGGADPQLAAAIKLMLEEIPKNGYMPPAKPKYPDRSGMGLPEADR